MPGGSERAAKGGRRDPSVAGRRVATAVYWVLVVFVITAGVRSVVAQVFFSPRDGNATASASCEEALDELHADLRRSALDARFGAHVDDAAAAPRSTIAWDHAYRSLENECVGSGRDRWIALGRMRYALEGILTRYDSDVAPLDARARSPSTSSNTRTNE